jgi:hypothetical protein
MGNLNDATCLITGKFDGGYHLMGWGDSVGNPSGME